MLLGLAMVTVLAGCGASASLTPTAAATSLVHARAYHSAVLLTDGRVLLIGGHGNGGTPAASTELYDPATGTFSATGPMTTPRLGSTATLLADGRVLVAGGTPYWRNSLASAEIL